LEGGIGERKKREPPEKKESAPKQKKSRIFNFILHLGNIYKNRGTKGGLECNQLSFEGFEEKETEVSNGEWGKKKEYSSGWGVRKNEKRSR